MYNTYVAEIELLLLSLVVAVTIRHRSELGRESLLTPLTCRIEHVQT